MTNLDIIGRSPGRNKRHQEAKRKPFWTDNSNQRSTSSPGVALAAALGCQCFDIGYQS